MRLKAKVERFIEKAKRLPDCDPLDLHISRMNGALVAVSRGRVILVGNPCVPSCPLATKLYGCPRVRRRDVQRAMEEKISSLGSFTPSRVLCHNRIAIPFGASEILMAALSRNLLQACVTVCDGAGTVVTDNPEVVQGIGARMNGLFYTSPVDAILRGLKRLGAAVVSSRDAAIDQVEGIKRAVQLGFHRIGVTLSGMESEKAGEIRRLEGEFGKAISLLSVCTTDIHKVEVQNILAHADLVWACASKPVREMVAPRALLQLGVKIPVYALTPRGIDLVANYESSGRLKEILPTLAGKALIGTRSELGGGLPLVMGALSAFLVQVEGFSTGSEYFPHLR